MTTEFTSPDFVKIPTKQAIDYLLFYAAGQDMGVYPAGVITADGVKKKRTEWENGWNAYGSELTNKWGQALSWWETLSSEQQDFLLELFCIPCFQISIREGKTPSPWLVMNDIFGYASADGEEIPLEEFPTVVKVWNKYEIDGLIAWASLRRKEEPILPLRTENYKAAIKFLS